MDQQNYYYGKHNIGPPNYQPVFGNSGSEYQAPGFSEHPTGSNFNNNSTGASSCSDLSNTTSAANLSRAATNHLTANPSTNEYNTGSYSRFYSYIPDNTVQNVSSTTSNASDCNNITYGSAFNSKSYENATSSAQVPTVIAVTSNSSPSRSYHSNINYGSFQSDYSQHKTLNQNYTAGPKMPSPSTQNRTTLNSSTAFTPMEHNVQTSVKSRANNTSEGKTSAKTSVIKALNAFNPTALASASASVSGTTPINYTKYVPSYPMYANNNKTAPNLEKSPSTVNRGMYLNTSTNHKNTEVYCPEPIPAARYSNPAYAINVSTPGTGPTNSHYLTSNGYPLNYGHHYFTQHQNSVSVPHHTRNLLSTSAYQPLDESVSANYFNRQNGLVVRPTPNTYKQGQLTYQNTYNYSRSNIINATNTNNATSNHSTLPKPQSQKPVDDSYNSLALDFDSAYDRRNFRQYSSVYGSNYIDPTGYDDYTQYPAFASANSGAVSFYPKSSSKHLLYNHSPGMYNNNAAHVQLTPQTSQSMATPSSSQLSLATTSTTTVVQHPVPINPSSSQQISSNYDASLHAHSILPPSLFNKNNREISNQYQQNPYTTQILYSTLQNGSYYSSVRPNHSTNSSEPHSFQACTEKSLQSPSTKYSAIDLEDQINSSKIPKMPGSVVQNPKQHQRTNDSGPRIPVINAQEIQRHYEGDSSQNAIQSDKNSCVYTSSSYPSCYQLQQEWQRSVSLAPTTTSSSTATKTSTTTHLHPKKQSLRDFLSTWNEDEEEEIVVTQKRSYSNHSQNRSRELAHLSNIKSVRLEKSDKINESLPVVVQPQVQASHFRQQPALVVPSLSSYSGLPIPNAAIIPPIHVGISVDNGSQNLPDIIIDIKKTKQAGEGLFERANVIQEVPKSSEKLYILDSIDVPLSDLNKYRHLSVVNKLPDNIVLPSPSPLPLQPQVQPPPPPPPPPPPLRHDNSLPIVNEIPSVKIIEEVDSNHTQHAKDDFEMSTEEDKDFVETKNISMFRKLLRKCRKRDQMRSKQKNLSTCQHSLQASNENNNDLSTPLRSLSPAHDFNSDAVSAVDLSLHSKEIIDDISVNSKEIFNEFIDDFSMCTDDSGSGYDSIASPLAEILQLTAPRASTINEKSNSDSEKEEKQLQDKDSGYKTGENEEHTEKDIENQNVQKIENVENASIDKSVDTIETIEIVESEEEEEKEMKIEIEMEMEKKKENEKVKEEEQEQEEEKEEDEKEELKIETQSDREEQIEESVDVDMHKQSSLGREEVSSMDTLKNYCIKTFNTKEFRCYFMENMINAPKEREEKKLTDKLDSSKNIAAFLEIEEPHYGNSVDVDLNEKDDEGKKPQSNSCDENNIVQPRVQSLRALAKPVVRLNQFYMSLNLKPLKIVFEFESQRKIAALDAAYDIGVNKVPTLQELAREVANTIYSFNVKPLQDICNLAIEKFNHLYMVSRIETTNTNIISEIDAAENITKPPKVAFADESIQISEQSLSRKLNKNGIQPSSIMTEIMEDSFDETPVKSLKILAQICVDELKRLHGTDMQEKSSSVDNTDSTNNSCDSDSDTSSTRSSQRGVITGGLRKSSYSETDNSSENESLSSSSSTGSDDTDNDDDESEDNDDVKKLDQIRKDSNQNIKNNIKQQIVEDWSTESNSCEEIQLNVNKSVEENANEGNNLAPVSENIVNVVHNPNSLKDICKDVLHAHSMIIHYDAPTLRYLCEHTLASAGMEIPLICFVQEEHYEYMTESQPSNEDEGVFLCLDSEFDETELANLFSGAGNGVYETVEQNAMEIKECIMDKSSFIDQCVELENILSSPLPSEENLPKAANDLISDETEFYMDPNEFHDSIQYEETVLQSGNHPEDSAAALAKLKKYLQKKYVHPLSYHKMFAINKLLRKYKVHQVHFYKKKPIVQKKMLKTLLKLRKRAKQKRHKPKKPATRRSARIAGKIKQKNDVSGCKVFKTTKFKRGSKSDSGKVEPTEHNCFCKKMNVNDFIQNAGNKKTITETDNESITRDILKLVAERRTLKRKLSICKRPKLSFNNEDGYCYDEDGQISEMLSSFINNSFDEETSGLSVAKKSRSRNSSIDRKPSKEQTSKKKKVPPIILKKQLITEGKPKCRKSNSNDRSYKMERALTPTETSTVKEPEKVFTPIFPTKASLKEIIPAKRTRFLSIDGSIMKYGAGGRRAFNQIKSLKENVESAHIVKRKNPSQKFPKATANDNTTKKNGQKLKHNNEQVEKLFDTLKTKNIDEPKEIPIQKNSQSQKCKAPMKIKENDGMKEMHISKPLLTSKEVLTNSKDEKITEKLIPNSVQDSTFKTITETKSDKILNQTHLRIRRKSRFSDRVEILTQVQSLNSNDKNFGQYHNPTENKTNFANTIQSTKLLNRTHEKSLSERSLCSTMVSPLKIIIEPKREASPQPLPSKDNQLSRHLVNVDAPEHCSQINGSVLWQKNVENRVYKPTRFLERVTNQVVNPFIRDKSNHNDKYPSVQLEPVRSSLSEKNEKSPEKTLITSYVNARSMRETMGKQQEIISTSVASSTIAPPLSVTKTDFAMIKPNLDIELLLPSTKILQPKPAKRIARAQTISHSESPMHRRHNEPMHLRSSNCFWNQNKFGSFNDSTTKEHQTIPMPYKTMEAPFTIPKRKPTPNTIFSPKAVSSPKSPNKFNNISAPLRKIPIDISSFPDPESLHIPSLDFCAASLGRSPLTFPTLKPTLLPVHRPLIDSKEIKTASNTDSKIIAHQNIIRESNRRFDISPCDPRQTNDKFVEQKSTGTVQAITPTTTPTNLYNIAPTNLQSSIRTGLEANLCVNMPTNTVLNASPNLLSNIASNPSPVRVLQSPNIQPINKAANIPKIPEMNTIPLELNRVVTQQRKIREMQRRNSLCVAEISTYQRNILNKFANSIKQKKLKFEDIIKTICNKQSSPSSSSASSSSSSDSSDSDSSESDSSSSSSSSSGSVRKYRRSCKKKRLHKRNTNSDDESSSESSSSSTSSSSSSRHVAKCSKQHRKSERKSERKSSKQAPGRKKPNPKPIFDIETIKQNALMGCALHEEMIRKRLAHSNMTNNENHCTPPYIQQNQTTSAMLPSNITDLTQNTDFTKRFHDPYVKLQRSSYIDNMAESYAQEQQNPNFSISNYKRKRSD